MMAKGVEYDNKEEQRRRQESRNEPQILEFGDIYFFYRPKVGSQEVKSIDDVRRFFMVTAPEETTTTTASTKRNSNKEKKSHRNLYRLFVIGKKSLPEIRQSEARSSERYWARVGGIFEGPEELTKELLSDEFRKGDAARPVGEGKYAIVEHQNHAEIAYILELPKEPGEAQKELGIEKEASYIVTVINPNKPVPEGYPSADQSPQYPASIQQEFKDNENFIPLTRNLELVNYKNAQIILIGAREGNDTIKKDIGIEIKDEPETPITADIFSKLKMRKEEVPVRPLTEGKLE
ncbi:MAG: hypothetical protein M3297_06365 [Thermoproteota archaeon]|nr:hypothetical protein [Thermoproteota archaeon]